MIRAIFGRGRRWTERAGSEVRGVIRRMQQGHERSRSRLVSLLTEHGHQLGPSARGDTFSQLRSQVLSAARRALSAGKPQEALVLCRGLRSVSIADPEAHLLEALGYFALEERAFAEEAYLKAHPVGRMSSRRRAARRWLRFQSDFLPFIGDWENEEILRSTDHRAEWLDRLSDRLVEILSRETVPHSTSSAAKYAGLRRNITSVRRPQLSERVSQEMERVRELIADTKFDEGAVVLARLIHEPCGFHPKVLHLWARVQTARSKYDHALALLAFSHWSARDRLVALRAASRISWIIHSYEAAAEAARQILKVEPEDFKTRSLLVECQRAALPASEISQGRKLAHVAFHVDRGGNFGDISLPEAVRGVFSSRESISWTKLHVHQSVDEERLDVINSSEGVVIGGGGLFLPDTSPNGVSGWQWNVSCGMLERISVPLVVFAVGYNLFRGQEFRRGLFQRSIETLAERALYIGLRNRGSMKHVQSILPSRLAEKVVYAPCPTTILSSLLRREPGFEAPPRESDLVVLNMAYDRKDRRFEGSYDDFLEQLAGFVNRVRQRGYRVEYAAHLPADNQFLTDIRASHGVELPGVDLQEMALADAYRYYRRASLVIGMRGHATMIPFGLGTPVLSLISHPKMAYFLEDIGKPEWGIDVGEPHLGDVLLERLSDILQNAPTVFGEISRIQEDLAAVLEQRVREFLDRR